VSAVDPGARRRETGALADEILVDLELNLIPLANIAMKCTRLARLLGDAQAERWFRLETGGYDLNKDPNCFWIGWDTGRGTRETRDKPDGEKSIWIGSIAELEATIATLQEQLRHLDVPPMQEASSPQMFYVPGTTLKEIANTFFQRQRSVSNTIGEATGVLAEVRTAIHSWVVDHSHALRFGNIPADAFQTAKSLVDDRLAVIAPDALRMFFAAQDRARSGSPEEWSQAMGSLRRMMKEMADRLYPATSRTFEGHVLDDAHFVNRLWQFVRERATGDRRALLTGQVQDVGYRIEALNDLTSKGVHDAVAQQEVEMAVVHLYLLFADLLSMLQPEELTALAEPESPKPEGAQPAL
jgi:AbiTii-like protein